MLGILVAVALLLSVQVVLAETLPVVRVDYAEVLEYSQGVWSSRYVQLSGGTLRLRSSAEILVVRTDPSSGLTPIDVLVDGLRPTLVDGTGFLWGSLVLRLDGRLHEVVVRFNASRSLEAITLLLGVPRGPVEPGASLSVPEILGLQPAGFSMSCLVSDPKALWEVVGGGFFVVNMTEVSLLGEKLYVLSVIVPKTVMLVGGDFLKCSYSYLYFAPPAYAQLLFPGASSLLYVNHPGYDGSLASSLVAGCPPHLALLATPSDVSLAGYSVVVAVARMEESCLGRVSFKVLPPQGATQDGETLTLKENTTIVLRFYREGVAVADVIVSTPPPVLVVEPPFHSLYFDILDRTGERVPNGSVLLLKEGRPTYLARVINGSAFFCGLVPGDYVLVVYRWGSLVARKTLRIPVGEGVVITNTTSFEVRFFRQGLGELLKNFTLVVRRGDTAETFAGDSSVLLRGIPPGNYTFEVWVKDRQLAAFNFSVSLDMGSQSFTLPVYYLTLRVLNAFDRPLEGASVVVSGSGLVISGTTGSNGLLNVGLLPSGEYDLSVTIGGAEFKERISLRGDSVKTIRTEVLIVLGGYAILLRYAVLAALVVLAALAMFTLLSVIKRLARRRGGVVEV